MTGDPVSLACADQSFSALTGGWTEALALTRAALSRAKRSVAGVVPATEWRFLAAYYFQAAGAAPVFP